MPKFVFAYHGGTAPRTPEDPIQVLNLPPELADRTIGRILLQLRLGRGHSAIFFPQLDRRLAARSQFCPLPS